MIRTSQTHPLEIDEIALANGRIGLTFCPGKKGASAFGAPWARDLALDLDAVQQWGAGIVLTLIEDHEFELLSVQDLGREVAARGMTWLHFPIQDVDVPRVKQMENWPKLSRQIHACLEAGGKVLIHCRGGLGRAGTIAALLLCERGSDPAAAIRQVRRARAGTIEVSLQEKWIHDRAQRDPYAKLMQACLLGGAMGDSLGAEIEFMSLRDIRRLYPEGLNDLPPYRGQRGAITDDTQMTLFTFEGLLRAQIRWEERGICHAPSVVHHALLRWYKTQRGKRDLGPLDRGLIEDARLWAACAPGMTCMAALAHGAPFGRQAENDSKGCGTIMRVAPIALIAERHLVKDLAIETSALTHGHVTGQMAAAAWAEMLADVAAGRDLALVAAETAADYAKAMGGAETAQAIVAALNAPRDGLAETVETLGGGWIAEEALAIALYACLAGKNLDEALRIAVTHGGDSDSTGAIAGNMLGLLYPDAVLSHAWASVIQGADIIFALSRDQASLAIDRDKVTDLAERYPGC